MTTKKTGILATIIDSFPVDEKAPAPAPAPTPTPTPAPTSRKKRSLVVEKAVEKKEMTKDEMRAVIYANALKTVAIAITNDATAVAYWKHAAVAYSTIYDSKPLMMGDEKLKSEFFALVAEKMGFSDVLATKVARGADGPEALLVKKQKAAARATQATYWTRLLNYSFPPAKGKKTPSHGGASDGGADGENEVLKGPVKSTFEGLVDGLSTVITGLEALEDAPKGANLVQALKALHVARAHLRGI